MPIYPPSKYDPPEPTTGCARHDAVASMLHHLETTHTWETEWDGRYEDTYCNGEMLSYRRIRPNGDIGYIVLIFCEDGANSYCYITADGKSCSVYQQEDYDAVMAAVVEGKESFAALLGNMQSARNKI